MNKQPLINTVLLGIIAVSLVWIALRQSQPAKFSGFALSERFYVSFNNETGQGKIVDMFGSWNKSSMQISDSTSSSQSDKNY